MPQVRIQVLGGFAAWGPGSEPITLPTRKAEALLAVLACRGGEPQPRERITALLWGDRGDRQARHSLSQTLTSIRGALGSAQNPMIAERETLAIDATLVTADVLELADLAGRDDPESLRHAASLYRGPLLDGVRLTEAAFEEWLSQERSRFQDLAISVLTRLAEREAACGNPDAAAAALERARGLDPLSEEIHRRLMRFHLERGNYNAVIRQYRDCSELLKRELGTVPEPATSALCEEARARLKGLGRPTAGPAPTRAAAPAGKQEIRFCTTQDGVRIAFAAAGHGPPLVKTANWLNHLEFDWQSPVWRHLLSALTGEFRLIRYDERGNGLSDWTVEDLSIDVMVRDLETVVDAAGLGRFPLLGISQGCAVAALYAVRHPERVSRLVLHGGYARGWRARGDTAEIARREAMLTLVLQGWGQESPAFRQFFTSFYIPDGNAEQMQWWNDLQRISTSPQNAVRLMAAFSEIDVRPLLPRLSVPTLVLHSRGDAAVPFAAGRELATLIPGARFVPLDSRNHVILEQEPAWPRFLDEMRRFLLEELGAPSRAE